MRVLVIGSGGREHALCQAIAKSPLLTKLWCAPGNPGIAEVAECVPIGTHRNWELVNFAYANKVDLVIPGPEGPLVDGIADDMAMFNIPVCGPSKTAAQLEGSKQFTKQVCKEFDIPTASYTTFQNADLALAFLRGADYPIVIKADGLAAGKGVVIVKDWEEAAEAIDRIMVRYEFGEEAGQLVVIEEYLEGVEASFFALCDGRTAIFLATAQDHKRVGDHDTGPNTGGMGAISPAPALSITDHITVWDEIIIPAVTATQFKGILFAGLMITANGPKLIEFNVRFGDPECQAILMRLQDDILPVLHAATIGDLRCYRRSHNPRLFDEDTIGLSVVMAAPGYPEAPRQGSVISGLEDVIDATVFHAGTRLSGGQLIAAGGRVLTVCAVSTHLADAQAKAYAAVSAVNWPEARYRLDIGMGHNKRRL